MTQNKEETDSNLLRMVDWDNKDLHKYSNQFHKLI